MTNTVNLREVSRLVEDMLSQQVAAQTAQYGVNWRSQNHDWTMATIAELIELVDETDWKWWKPGDTHVDLAKWEAVDVGICVLSLFLQHAPHPQVDYVLSGVDNGVRTWLQYGSEEPYPILGSQEPIVFEDVDFAKVRGRVKQLAQAVLVEGRTGYSPEVLHAYMALMQSLHLSMYELYKMYIGKLCLNELRRENGYGVTYQPYWSGTYDVMALAEVIKPMRVSASLREDVTHALRRRYSEPFTLSP